MTGLPELDALPPTPLEEEEVAVLVTTAHRGVFFGYTPNTDSNPIVLRRGRMCLSWSAAMKGVFGLAVMGPDADCLVGPAADMLVYSVTAVALCSDQAIANWEAAPWKP